MQTRYSSILLLIIFFFQSGSTSAFFAEKKKKARAFEQGQSSVHAGAGMPSLVKPKTDSLLIYGEVERKSLIPIYLRYEYALTDHIGLGAVAAYSNAKVTVTDNTDPDNVNGYNYTYLIFAARGAWHQDLAVERLDAYGVLTLGFNITSAEAFGPSNVFEPYKKAFIWGVHVGANYYFTDNIGIHAEAGYGISIFNAGVSVRFSSR
jgi:hypothetical protein